MDINTDALIFIMQHWPASIYGVLLGIFLIIVLFMFLLVFSLYKFRETTKDFNEAVKESNKVVLAVMDVHHESIKQLESFGDRMTQLGAQCHQAQRESMTVVSENTKVLNKMVGDLSVLTAVIQRENIRARSKAMEGGS